MFNLLGWYTSFTYWLLSFLSNLGSSRIQKHRFTSKMLPLDLTHNLLKYLSRQNYAVEIRSDDDGGTRICSGRLSSATNTLKSWETLRLIVDMADIQEKSKIFIRTAWNRNYDFTSRRKMRGWVIVLSTGPKRKSLLFFLPWSGLPLMMYVGCLCSA